MEDQSPVVEDQVIDPADQATEEVTEGAQENKVAYDTFKKVLGEKKAMQKRLAEFEAEQKKLNEAKMAEEGKLKELLELKQSELAELSPFKEEAEQYRSYFEKRLEDAKDGLTDIQKKAVDGFAGSLSDKLAMAEEFKGSIPSRTSSPGADRPNSASGSKFDLNDYLGPEGTKRLTQLFYSNRDLYNEVIRAKNNRQ